MRLSRVSAVTALLVPIFMLSNAHAATIVNGDLDGPVSTGSAAPGWFNWQKTPDTCDANGPFNNTPNPWALSPNGGTFVRTAGVSGVNSEAFAQNVTDFVPGVLYDLSFYQTNLGFEHPVSGAWNGTDGYYDVLIDGVLADSTPVLTKPAVNTDPISWSFTTVSFVAPSAAFELALVGQSASTSGLAAYMGIDGISVRVASIPAPGAFCIFVLAGITSRRRR